MAIENVAAFPFPFSLLTVFFFSFLQWHVHSEERLQSEERLFFKKRRNSFYLIYFIEMSGNNTLIVLLGHNKKLLKGFGISYQFPMTFQNPSKPRWFLLFGKLH